MISASHNTFDYNGIKIFGEEGFKLSDELEEKIEAIVLDKESANLLSPSKNIGKISYSEGAIEEYCEYLLSTGEYDLSGMKIAIDCANGSASVSAERIFSSLGAEAYIISADPNGTNINDSCGSTHLEAIKNFVVENGMDAGVAFDGDADRCLAVDEKGNEIDGDYIMAIMSLDMKARGKLKKDTVVGTVMTNFGFQKFCEENGIRFIAAKVGDRYVLEILNQEGYSFGGEQSGHLILRDYATTGDGQLTALSLLSLVKKSGKCLSELAGCMKKYPQHIINLTASQEGKLALFTDSDIKEIIADGERRLSGMGRLVIRPSGTEPLVRVMAEGNDEALTKEIVSNIAERLKEKLKSY